VREFDKAIPLNSENIANIHSLNLRRCITRRNRRKKTRFFMIAKQVSYYSLFLPEFAKMVVGKWMDSPPHRKNILSEDYQCLNCLVRFSKNPYKDRKLPFARLTQNFGGYVK
jgi:hypothetical protein